MQFRSNAKPSLFAYPPETKPPQAEAKEKITTAVLSISQVCTAEHYRIYVHPFAHVSNAIGPASDLQKHKNKKKGADEAEEPKPDEMTVDKPDADAEKKDEGGMEVDKPAEAGDAQEPVWHPCRAPFSALKR
jgi:26S proteasome regulatory subunit N2